MAVLSQEIFRYLFHIVTKQAQVYLAKIIGSETNDKRTSASTSRTNEIQLDSKGSFEFQKQIPISYVSGLGFGLMNAAFSLMNVLTDYIGPGTVGLKGDSAYFLLVSSLTALAFVLLNVAWSILMSESIEKSDKRLAGVVLVTHFAATTITFVNRIHLQLISILVVYALTVLCGLGAFQVAGLNPKRLFAAPASSVRQS